MVSDSARYFRPTELSTALASLSAAPRVVLAGGTDLYATGVPVPDRMRHAVLDITAIERLRTAVHEASGSKASAAAISDLAEAVQGLVYQMRIEQQTIRDWVDGQAEQQRDIKRLLEMIVRENAGE